MPTQTTLISQLGEKTTHHGTSGMTVTADRAGENVQVAMVFDLHSKEEAITMVAALLCQLEELHGEGFVTACIAIYAIDTKKEMVSSPTSDYQVGLLRRENSLAKRYRS